MSGIVADNVEGVSGTVKASLAVEVLTTDPIVNPLPAWSVANRAITGRRNDLGVGTQLAALSAGGEIAGGPNPRTTCEEYDGTCWAAANPLNNSQNQAPGYGIQTAAGIVGGGMTGPSPNPSHNTELYDGTSWATSVAQPEIAKNSAATSGTTSAAFIAGGNSSAYTATTFEWNGSTWSAGGALQTGRFDPGGCGTLSAGLSAGGSQGAGSNYDMKNTETYDGTSWSTAQNLNTGRTAVQGGLLGIQTDAMIFLGNTDYGSADYGALMSTEEYDGTTWRISPAFCLYKLSNSSAGSTSAAVQWSYDDNHGGTYCQEYNLASTEATSGSVWYNSTEKRLKVATNIGVWASGTNYPASRGNIMGCGESASSALVWGGEQVASPTEPLETFEYDGSSWAAGGALPQIANSCEGVGRQTAGFCIGGSSGGITANCIMYLGASWANTNSLTQARRNFCAWGNLSSSGCSSGHIGGASYQSGTEEWDALCWSSSATELQTASSVAAFGSSAYDGIKAGGYNSGQTPKPLNFVEHFDGVCWSSRNGLPVRMYSHRSTASGTSNSGMVFGGNQVTDVYGNYVGGGGYCTEYDGVVWLSRSNMVTATYGAAPAGTSSSALNVAGTRGNDDVRLAFTEEYTVGSGTNNAIIELH